MKLKNILLTLCVITTFFSCNSSDKKISSEPAEVAINWQETFKSLDTEKLKPFLNTEDYDYLKTYLGSFSEEQINATKEAFKNQKTEVIDTVINENTASVKLCCDAAGNNFNISLYKLKDEWKVNFKKTIEYAQ